MLSGEFEIEMLMMMEASGPISGWIHSPNLSGSVLLLYARRECMELQSQLFIWLFFDSLPYGFLFVFQDIIG